MRTPRTGEALPPRLRSLLRRSELRPIRGRHSQQSFKFEPEEYLAYDLGDHPVTFPVLTII